MNYFYFFLFIFLSILIFIRPIIWIIANWVLKSKRLNKMKFINEHLVSEEIEELIKDKFYLEKLIDLMKNIDNDLQSFIYKFAELEKITNNLETEFEV